MFSANCRYYPTCSEYAKWQFELNSRVDKALFKTFLRILRCNQLFIGGIDYPIIEYKRENLLQLSNPSQIVVKYWLIPKNFREFFVIKNLNFNNN
jgi:putative membrane protein insertion efficiency factor